MCGSSLQLIAIQDGKEDFHVWIALVKLRSTVAGQAVLPKGSAAIEGIPLKSVARSNPSIIGAVDGLITAFLDVSVKICKTLSDQWRFMDNWCNQPQCGPFVEWAWKGAMSQGGLGVLIVAWKPDITGCAAISTVVKAFNWKKTSAVTSRAWMIF